MSPPEAPRRAAARYIENGWAPIPIPAGKKNPKIRNWQDERVGLEDVPRCWTNGQNIGVLTGSPSGGLVDVDLDAPELLAVADRFLEPTLTSGRPGARRSHRWMRVVGSIRRASFNDIDGTVLLEVRGDGHQTIVPPSVHPSGERYEWSSTDPAEPVGVGLEDLMRPCRELVTAGLVARHLPGRGRHDLALALAGFLLRRGLAPEVVAKIMHAAWAAAGSDEARNREAHADIDGIVRDTAEKIRTRREASGGRALDGIVPGLTRAISKHWDWSGEEPVTSSNGASPNGQHQTHPAFNHTDQGNAERFVHRHGENLRYCYPWKKWLVWDGRRWKIDDSGEVERRAKETVKAMFHDADPGNGAPINEGLVKHALRSQARNRIDAMIALARSEPGIAALPDDFDADRWLLTCENGTVDLRTGNLREHSREDLITKIVPVGYDPHAGAPRFEKFLREALVEDDLIDFVRRFAGYSLTGSTRERVVAILHGRQGKNGKSTLVELLYEVMGDYATTTATETLLTKRYEGVGNDVAALKGARFVATAEIEAGRRLAEAKVKQLTGNDTVQARYLYGEPFDFKPEFKLWLSTNNKPEIQGTDDAIWDRIRLIPFNQRFEGRAADPELPEKLRAEIPGVLAWMVRGCLEWLADGLGEPEQVRAAVEDYREEMDIVGKFISEVCTVDPRASVGAKNVWEAWQGWCVENKEDELTRNKFGAELKKRGYDNSERDPQTRRTVWKGIGLWHPDDPGSTGLLAGDGASES